jgi:hypothetical protein
MYLSSIILLFPPTTFIPLMVYLSLSLPLMVYLIVVMPPIILVPYLCLSDNFEGYVIGVGVSVSFWGLIRYDCYCLMDD